MTYIALARHWRPRSFDALLGQDMVKQALTNALTQQRLHHAYLFTGTRGVGKTSIARLLAKALNCEQGMSATPCLVCETCLSVEQGRFVDLLEIDGASKTKVEDIRELLENVQYAPVSGRFKIYLIDEVHMLSQHSFNALLKTLEEPPAHVKFLLATTEPQKMPATILSRCIQFNLKPLALSLIQSHLETILQQESLTAEPEALYLVAGAAQGSMRDALSILEQVMACADGVITAVLVRKILGYTQQDYAAQILQAVAVQDGEILMSFSHQVAQEGGHYAHVIESLLHAIHQLACFQQLPANSQWITCPLSLQPLATYFAAETLQLFYQLLLKGQADFMLAPSPQLGFEMQLLRLLAFQPMKISEKPPLSHESLVSMPVVVPDVAPPQPMVSIAKDMPAAPPSPSLSPSPEPVEKEVDWKALIAQLNLSGLVLHAAEHAEWVSLKQNMVTLNVLLSHRSMFTPNIKKQLEDALTKHQQTPIKITLEFKEALTDSPAQRKQRHQESTQKEAREVLARDPVFQTIQQQFDAELVQVTVDTEN
ncbi:MAG: DNA polymerase III subunit gamma/tau [Gammaproteobacteria bacterium]|nr:DNA polymerase III subunit gamma/tau [Gammaproteobacteria bacterium]